MNTDQMEEYVFPPEPIREWLSEKDQVREIPRIPIEVITRWLSNRKIRPCKGIWTREAV